MPPGPSCFHGILAANNIIMSRTLASWCVYMSIYVSMFTTYTVIRVRSGYSLERLLNTVWLLMRVRLLACTGAPYNYRVVTLHALTCTCTIFAHSSIEYLGDIHYLVVWRRVCNKHTQNQWRKRGGKEKSVAYDLAGFELASLGCDSDHEVSQVVLSN